MEHATFGKIVAALRREQINFSNGHNWSQQDLADETRLTQRIVSKIERGRQAQLDGEVLQKLARAFNLTSLERREFFAMASDVNGSGIVRADLCDDEVFEQVWSLLKALCVPAFLTDPLGDIIGVNRSLLAFHNISMTKLHSMRSTAAGVNNLSLILSAQTPLREALGSAWQSIALANVQQWRVTTLRYRHTRRYEKLFTALSMNPDFRMLWVVGNDHERAMDDCSRLRSYTYKHGVHGLVAYTVFVNISLSTFGELFLSAFVPQDDATVDLFKELASKNKNALSLAHWPNAELVSA